MNKMDNCVLTSESLKQYALTAIDEIVARGLPALARRGADFRFEFYGGKDCSEVVGGGGVVDTEWLFHYLNVDYWLWCAGIWLLAAQDCLPEVYGEF